ncbi:hypothetical protein KGF56_000175 [Candida oxycetoniae]|uniref:YTH domain-containing protein n=1 Tax=Candida oxycetoniae TaxID=497107 RepID=A0AAI9T0Z8_9ASCO|nr:uncharacterized protein KGF56_000175 [Candida oxycetoniae]KAI3406883.2 hypothetical protein KGF56_000175 [Candida oxycetoniae]
MHQYDYCTPWALHAIQSIETEIDNFPLILKPNIWKTQKTQQQQQQQQSKQQSQLQIQLQPSQQQLPSSSSSVPPQLLFKSYKGTVFTVPLYSRFFVIKSYNVLDINASFQHSIWTSTELGNRRLDAAYKSNLEKSISPSGKMLSPIFLFFSVNSSGKFCGVSQMTGPIDYTQTSDIWCEHSKWKGVFPVEWLLIKDVPNKYFQHLKVPNNEYKPVTNSRDTQEIPYEVGVQMLKIMSSFK